MGWAMAGAAAGGILSGGIQAYSAQQAMGEVRESEQRASAISTAAQSGVESNTQPFIDLGLAGVGTQRAMLGLGAPQAPSLFDIANQAGFTAAGMHPGSPVDPSVIGRTYAGTGPWPTLADLTPEETQRWLQYQVGAQRSSSSRDAVAAVSEAYTSALSSYQQESAAYEQAGGAAGQVQRPNAPQLQQYSPTGERPTYTEAGEIVGPAQLQDFSYSTTRDPNYAGTQLGQFGELPQNIQAPEAMTYQPTTQETFMNDPLTQSLLQRSGQAIESSAAARGMQLSGATLQRLQENAQEIALQRGQQINAERRADVGVQAGLQQQAFGQELGAGTFNLGVQGQGAQQTLDVGRFQQSDAQFQAEFQRLREQEEYARARGEHGLANQLATQRQGMEQAYQTEIYNRNLSNYGIRTGEFDTRREQGIQDTSLANTLATQQYGMDIQNYQDMFNLYAGLGGGPNTALGAASGATQQANTMAGLTASSGQNLASLTAHQGSAVASGIQGAANMLAAYGMTNQQPQQQPAATGTTSNYPMQQQTSIGGQPVNLANLYNSIPQTTVQQQQ